MARIGVYDLDWHYGFYKKKIFNLDLKFLTTIGKREIL